MVWMRRGLTDRWSRRDYPAAWRAFRRLMADTQDTAQVFTIVRALAGRSVERGYLRMLDTPQGGRIAYEHVELLESIQNLSALQACEADTVAAELCTFQQRSGVSARALMEKSRSGLARNRNRVPHPYAWFGRRVRDTHDIWHVLTGYGPDPLGEACLAAFTFAQTGGLGWALIAGGAAFVVGRTDGHPMRRAILEGFSRGKRAAWLPAEDYLLMLDEPLANARQRLGLEPTLHYDRVPQAYRLGKYALCNRPRAARRRRPDGRSSAA